MIYGKINSYGNLTYQFNDRGRLSNIIQSGGTTSNIYNALGQLIEIYGYGGTTILAYDTAGHILGEYTITGALIQETVWMGDLPVATLRPNGSSISIYYVHADHLGTPRKVTRPSDNGLMWRWDSDTFGSVAPNQNPSGLGTFVYNLRFPGQYYRAQSGLYYNMYRDYDPQTGRYLQSDPIGLKGGSYSTYSYTNNNPISGVDPWGLVRWTGSGVIYGAIVGGGGVFGIYDLTSECINGKKVYARVHVAGPATGFGLAASGTGGSLELDDPYDTPDYHSLEGSFKIVWASGAWGGGYGIDAIQIGDARQVFSHGAIGGIDLSIGGAAGKAWVVQHSDSSCCGK